jgi:ERCC4-type nuclease
VSMGVIKVDTREPQKYFDFLVNTFPDLKFQWATIPEGDYQSTRCLVERKKMSDLYGSIMGKTRRFYKQLDRIACHDDIITCVLVTGSIPEFVKEMKELPKPNGPVIVNPDLLFGAIASVAYRYGVIPMYIENEWEGMITMVKTMIAIDKGKHQVPVRRDPDILCARLLGVSTKQLSELLDHHGSLEGLCKAKESDFQKVKGIGPAKAAEIHRVLKCSE